MSISSIDDLLMGGSTAQNPMSPEEKFQDEPEQIDELHNDAPDYDTDDDLSQPLTDDKDSDEPDDAPDEDDDDRSDKQSDEEEDEYGNKKERMSKGMKDRLDRKEKQHQREVEQRDREIQQLRVQLQQQGASREVQQATRDFEYNPEAAGDWKQQLAQFVRQEVSSMTRDEQENQRRQMEEQAQGEFRDKFRAGMNKFEDFVEVVDAQPIDTEMTMALRGMADPAAFIYAAAKRHPQELERISKLRDPYARVLEMGKLEERMRRNKPTTKAPRPLGRTPEDATTKTKPKERDSSGDDLLAKADAKRLSTVRTRLKNNR